MNCKFKSLLRYRKLNSGAFKIFNFYRTLSAEYSTDVKQYVGEKKGDWNILKAFASKKNSFMELHRYGPFQASTERIKMWLKKTLREADLMDQRYIEERHKILGNDLATAHFIVFRGGRVKFIGHSDWTSKNKDEENDLGFPKKFTEGWLLEGVDASGLHLRYEAFRNLSGLCELKELILRDCPHIDDWCIDRISGEYGETLELLDLSGCKRITEKSLSCIYRLKNIKTLKLENVVNSRTFEYACLLLEEAMPQLTVVGVNYLTLENNNFDRI